MGKRPIRSRKHAKRVEPQSPKTLKRATFFIKIMSFSIEIFVFSIEILSFSIKILAFSIEIMTFFIEILSFSIEIMTFSIKILVFSIEILSFFIKISAFSIKILSFSIEKMVFLVCSVQVREQDPLFFSTITGAYRSLKGDATTQDTKTYGFDGANRSRSCAGTHLPSKFPLRSSIN